MPNPNHDKLGRFASGRGGGYTAANVSAGQRKAGSPPPPKDAFGARIAEHAAAEKAAGDRNAANQRAMMHAPNSASPRVTRENIGTVIAAQQKNLDRALSDMNNKSIAPSSRRLAKEHAADAKRILKRLETLKRQ